jgi:predicted glycoside hydrolase/deacetylase ChbG (UPF0249 family)
MYRNLPLRIIINADDFGLNEKINRATYDLLQARFISSATIMANGSAVDEAIEMSQSLPEASFGVHLNLTGFPALTEAMRRSHLCDAAGIFNSQFREVSSLRDTELILNEWREQVSMLQDAGLKIAHLDSHHHVHTYPTAFIALKKLIKVTGIHRVRNTRNLVLRNEKIRIRNRAKYFSKFIWNRAIIESGKAIMTDKFCSVQDFINVSSAFPKDIPKKGTIELMCHPGHDTMEMVNECLALNSDLAQSTGIRYQLISYNEL